VGRFTVTNLDTTHETRLITFKARFAERKFIVESDETGAFAPKWEYDF